MKCKMNGNEVALPCTASCELFGDCVAEYQRSLRGSNLQTGLKAYEDIGLTPHQLQILQDTCSKDADERVRLRNLVASLQADLARATEDRDNANDYIEVYSDICDKYRDAMGKALRHVKAWRARAEKAETERDAAVEDMKQNTKCRVCKHFPRSGAMQDCLFYNQCGLAYLNFVWRGAQQVGEGE